MARADRATPSPEGAPRAGDDPDRVARAERPLTPRGRETRAKLLRAARTVFDRTGYSDVRITDITGEAGVANGTFYTYFDTKEEIFGEIAAEVLSDMSAAARPRPGDPQSDPKRQIELAIRRYFESVRRNARIARSIEEVQAREPGIGSARRGTLHVGVERIERWIRRLQGRELCDPALEPWPTAQALHAMNVSVAYDHLVHRDAPEETDALVAAVVRIWCASLGLRG